MPSDNHPLEPEFCPRCGQMLRDGDKFCAGCGAPLGVPDSQVLRIAYQALALFTGPLGIHNFYAGFWGRAVCQLGMTLAGSLLWQLHGNTFSFPILGAISGIWAFLEIFLQKTDPQGRPMRSCGCLAQIGIVLLIAVVVSVFGGFSWVIAQ